MSGAAPEVRIASRGSALARWQAEHVAARLRALLPALQVAVDLIQTTGDQITNVPLSWIGDRGLFTREIDRAVLSGAAHAAVHSLKDLPTRLEDGLALAAVLEREDPRDALVTASGSGGGIGALREGAVVGTSSLRRRALLLNLRPDLAVEDLRGNVDTRLEHVRDGRIDAAILAVAGLRRLGLEDAIADVLDPPGWVPAVGQGALAVVCRAGDDDVRALLEGLDHPETRAAVTAERAFLRNLEGGCQVPIGALGNFVGGELRLAGFVGSPDGRDALRGETTGTAANAEETGIRLAEEMTERGARGILAAVRATAERRTTD